MSNISKSNRRLIKCIVKPYLNALVENNVYISEQIYRISVRLVSKHLKEHIDKYRISSSKDKNEYEPEVYKILSWYSFILIDMEEKESGKSIFSEEDRAIILEVAITHLNIYLFIDTGYKLSSELINKIFLMGLNNKDTEYDEFAIGKNGLYLSFKSASNIFHSIQREKGENG